jgi:putative transposase
MLKWVMTEMMRIEAEAKVGATKGKHAKERTTYFSGARAPRVDTRLGTVYLLVPKVRKGGYVLFFISERRRSAAWKVALRTLSCSMTSRRSTRRGSPQPTDRSG